MPTRTDGRTGSDVTPLSLHVTTSQLHTSELVSPVLRNHDVRRSGFTLGSQLRVPSIHFIVG